MMAPPSRKHQRISTRLVSIIDRYIEEHKGKYQVYAAPFAVYLDERSNTYRTVEGAINFLTKIQKEWMERRIKKQISAKRCGFILIREDTLPMYLLAFKRCQ